MLFLQISGYPTFLKNSTLSSIDNQNEMLVPVLQPFESTDELLASSLWKNLQKKKDPMVAKSTVLYVKDTTSTYYFDPSEYKEEATLSGLPFWKSKTRDINLIEVQYGDARTALLANIPVSPCLSSELSSGGGSYTHAFEFEHELSSSIGPGVSGTLGVVGVQLDAATSIGFQFNSVGSLSCKAEPGMKTQVFAAIGFKYFPLARKRLVCVHGDEIATAKWKKYNEESEYEDDDLGAVFFDMSTLSQHQCVTIPQYLRCNDYGQSMDPRVELKKYLEQR